jgi:V8-like Glu-specific endopeptidase
MRWVARHAALITVPCALAIVIVPAADQGHGQASGPAGTRAGRSRAVATGHPVTVTGHRTTVTGHPAAVTGHRAAVTASQQAGVRRYWTRARMERAVPLRPLRATLARHRGGQPKVSQRTPITFGRTLAVAPRTARPPRPRRLSAAVNGTLWSGGGAVARTTGKVFFSMGSHDYVCSGSTVASADSAVVVTAGHCVKNGTGVWATNWTFVPGYTNGNDPYGSFTANQFYVASEWSTQASNDYDVAFVKLNPAKVGGTQVKAVQEVGGQGIEFGVEPTRVAAFGYPADPPYNGQRLYYCRGAVHPDPYHATDDTGLACAMTEGSSGGPWLAGFGQASGTGAIVSVSSFKYSTNARILYGTPFGSVAQQLYRAAQAR